MIYERTKKRLVRDDAFFYSLMQKLGKKSNSELSIIFNTDMLVSTTDVPLPMDAYHIGRKAVLMNISDLVVKGVKPEGIFISLGMPGDLNLAKFKQVMLGIIDYCVKQNIEYIGGDLNQTNEIVISPTVFGFKEPAKIIYRAGVKPGDILISNGKFGLTGTGFEIVLVKKKSLTEFSTYSKSIKSVIEPQDIGKEAFILADNQFASASIDSSDGLHKSLTDLMLSNPNCGFEIDFDENLIDKEAIDYSLEFNIPLEKLVFYGGEEFIHLFTIDKKDFNSAQKIVKKEGGQIYKIGRVISEEKIYYLIQGTKVELKDTGFEHFK